MGNNNLNILATLNKKTMPVVTGIADRRYSRRTADMLLSVRCFSSVKFIRYN